METRSTPRFTAEEKERLSADGQPLDFTTFTNGFLTDIKEYVSTQRTYLLLSGSEKASLLLARALRSTLTLLFCATGVLFLSLALAWYIGERTGSIPFGFCCVGLFYFVSAGVFLLWWHLKGRDRFVLDRINDFTDGI